MKKFLLIIFMAVCCFSFGQNARLDSLWNVYNKGNTDTSRLKAIDALALHYYMSNPDSSILLAGLEVKLIQSLSLPKKEEWLANAYRTLAAANMNMGEHVRSLEYHFKVLKIYQQLNNKIEIGKRYSFIGNVYLVQSNYPKALEYYLTSLKLLEGINDEPGKASCYMNIGVVYGQLFNYKKSVEYNLKALNINEKIKDVAGMSRCYNNIGLAYRYQYNYTKALEYLEMAFKIEKEKGDKQGVADFYNNVGGIYDEQFNYPKALQCYLTALQLQKEIGNRAQISPCYLNLSTVYLYGSGDLKKALLYCDSSLQLSKENGNLLDESRSYEVISEIYYKTARYKEAYESHSRFKKLTDSIFNEENSRQLGDMKTRFEVEKKEAELKTMTDAEEIVAAEEKKKQQFIIYTVGAVLMIVLIFSLFLFKRFRIAARQKHIIQQQKVLVDKAYEKLHEKNTEVMDSIYYAKRIQTAFITPERYIQRNIERLMKKN